MARSSFQVGGAHALDLRYQLAAPLVRTLPGTGSRDGDTIRYAASASIEWRFCYDAASSYWKFVGGGPLISETDTFEATSSATYVNLATVGPSVSVPFLGDYIVTFGAETFAGANAAAWMSVDVGAGAADGDGAVLQQSSAVTSVASVARARTKTVAAGTSIVCKYRSSSGSASFLNRFLNVLPLRVH